MVQCKAKMTPIAETRATDVASSFRETRFWGGPITIEASVSPVAPEELLQTPLVSFLGFSTGIGNALDRRQLLRASAVISAAAALPRVGAAETPGTAFGGSSVRDLSRVLASKGLERADDKVPVSVVFVCYEQY